MFYGNAPNGRLAWGRSGCGLLRLELLKLLAPELRRSQANIVLAHQRADLRQPVLRAKLRRGIAAPIRLHLAIQRMQRRVKGGFVILLYGHFIQKLGATGLRLATGITKAENRAY